jgi:hypothetical protein
MQLKTYHVHNPLVFKVLTKPLNYASFFFLANPRGQFQSLISLISKLTAAFLSFFLSFV